MKKIITILSIVLIVLGICGCNSSSKSKYQAFDVLVSYYGSVNSASGMYAESEYDYLNKYYYSDGDLEGTTKSVLVLGQEYTGEYKETRSSALDVFDSDVYYVYDENRTPTVCFHIERKTGKILHFFNAFEDRSDASADSGYSEQECKEIAEGVLAEIVDDPDAYIFDSSNRAPHYSGGYCYIFLYVRIVEGVRVQDFVQLHVLDTGEIETFYLKGYRNFDDVKTIPQNYYEKDKIDTVVNKRVNEICQSRAEEYDVQYEQEYSSLIKMDDGSLGLLVSGTVEYKSKTETNDVYADSVEFIICLGDYEKKLSLHMFK